MWKYDGRIQKVPSSRLATLACYAVAGEFESSAGFRPWVCVAHATTCARALRARSGSHGTCYAYTACVSTPGHKLCRSLLSHKAVIEMATERNVYWDSSVFRHPAKAGLSFLLSIYHGFRHCVASPVGMTPSPSDEGFPIRRAVARGYA